VTADAPTPETPQRSLILAALERITDPKSGRGLVSAGLVQGLAIGPGRAGFMIEVAAADAGLYARVRDEAEAALLSAPHVTRAQVVLTAEDGSAPPPPPAPYEVRVRKGAPPAEAHGHDPHHGHDHGPAPAAPPQRAPAAAMKPAHVGAVVAVASGKGGVGKSTVAVNLAVALGRLGYRVGLLDADVYGPSAPQMLGITAEPEIDGKKLIPPVAWGIKAISIGLIVDAGQAMIWRGPMAAQALTQLLNDVAWGTEAEPLDVLIVDMPPGTGDIQLTLVQRTALAGAVLVSTPQEVALIDVRRGAAMFEKTATPILGVVENMAYFPDPTTGAPIEIFGRGGAQRVAGELGVPFLGEIPIDPELRRSGDDGRPLAATAPDSPAGLAFTALAETLAARLAAGDTSKPPPKIIWE
jgi:ATP-binding protein involved in chromosome partitioning